MTSFVDANLYHNYVTGRAVTGVLKFFKGTPIDWFSKKQNTVESSTYMDPSSRPLARLLIRLLIYVLL
jgi:hypothetical protein